MRTGGTVRLGWAFARRRLASTFALVLLGALLAGTVIGLATVRDSAARAIEDSLRADLGGRTHVLETSDPKLIELLRKADGVSPVVDDLGNLTTDDGLAATVMLRTTTDPALELGVLTEGARPANPGELLLSESVARSLGIQIGESITMESAEGQKSVKVTGYVVDTADVGNRTAIGVVNDSPAFISHRWLSNTSFFDMPDLAPLIDSAESHYASTRSLLESAESQSPPFLSALRFVPAGAGILAVIVLAAVLTAMGRGWRRDADALVAAGMSPRTAWRRLAGTILVLVLIGELLGTVAVLAVMHGGRSVISGWLAQHWVRLDVPWSTFGLVLAATAVVDLAAVPALRRVPVLASWAGRRAAPRRRSAYAAVAVGTLGAMSWVFGMWAVDRNGGEVFGVLVIPGVAMVTGAIAFLIAHAAAAGLRPAGTSLLRGLVAALRPVAAAAAVIAVLSSSWAAATVHQANQSEALDSPEQPAGSFVVSEMADEGLASFRELYAERGGTEVLSFRLPLEAERLLRVTTTDMVTCMADEATKDPSGCFERTLADDGIAALGPPGSPVRAAPEMLTGGKAGLLLYPRGSGTTSRTATVAAEPDPPLGGYLPGLVLPADGPLAREFGLFPTDRHVVALLDFHTLRPEDQFFIRSAALRLAPAAALADGTDPSAYDRQRTIANAASMLGAAAALILLLIGGTALLIAHRLPRRIVVDIGASSRARWGLAARWAAVPALSLAVTLPLAIATASYGGRATDGGYGALWILPGTLGALAAIALGLAFLRVPPHTRD